jgi:hypothetical protein
LLPRKEGLDLGVLIKLLADACRETPVFQTCFVISKDTGFSDYIMIVMFPIFIFHTFFQSAYLDSLRSFDLPSLSTNVEFLLLLILCVDKILVNPKMFLYIVTVLVLKTRLRFKFSQ